jgi:hypothetical protein
MERNFNVSIDPTVLDQARANANAQRKGKVWPHMEPTYYPDPHVAVDVYKYRQLVWFVKFCNHLAEATEPNSITGPFTD